MKTETIKARINSVRERGCGYIVTFSTNGAVFCGLIRPNFLAGMVAQCEYAEGKRNYGKPCKIQYHTTNIGNIIIDHIQ